MNVLNTLTTSTAPVNRMTGVSTAPDPPYPAVTVNVAGCVYPAPKSSSDTAVITPPVNVTTPATAVWAAAPTGELNCNTGGFTLLYPDPPSVTVIPTTSYVG